MTELELTKQVADYLKLRGVMYHFDFGSGTKMTIGQAMQQKRINERAWPDLFIAEARGGHHGLFIELKVAGAKIYLKDGSIASNSHLQEQAKVLRSLWNKHYYTAFCCGFDEAKKTIDHYLDL